MDPVLVDPHQEGKLAVFPAREVNWENLPKFELLILSHHHLDHFDIRTLSMLPRDVHVAIPKSSFLENSLRQLGYNTIHPVTTNLWIELEGARLLFTPSDVSFPEMGVLLQDRSGTFWNQVDTVLTLKHIDLVIALAGNVDLLLATWQPMLETAVQQNDSLQFPTASYAQVLANIARVRPGALAPGANGFQYLGEGAWLNHLVFPQSRERFLRDVATMLPELDGKTFPFDPGDVLEMDNGKIQHKLRDSRFVSSVPRDPFALEFCPITAQRPLSVSAQSMSAEEHRSIVTFCEQTLPRFVIEHPILFRTHRDWDIVYQLEVAFPDHSDYWSIDFSTEVPRCSRKQNALANMFCGVTGSGLASILNGRHTWEGLYLTGEFYQYQRIYGVWRNGLVLPTGLDVTNPLVTMFPEEEVFERMISNTLAEVRGKDEVYLPHAVSTVEEVEVS